MMLLVFSLFSLIFLGMSRFLFFPVGCTVYSFCVGVYVMSVPGYSHDTQEDANSEDVKYCY
jgi:hypothetical protein